MRLFGANMRALNVITRLKCFRNCWQQRFPSFSSSQNRGCLVSLHTSQLLRFSKESNSMKTTIKNLHQIYIATESFRFKLLLRRIKFQLTMDAFAMGTLVNIFYCHAVNRIKRKLKKKKATNRRREKWMASSQINHPQELAKLPISIAIFNSSTRIYFDCTLNESFSIVP